ncbi:MAG: hypothetical protein KC731_20185, partial [Myxococcales bacterium]|nr:hypothetical protein [Myxococcales bacterium]
MPDIWEDDEPTLQQLEPEPAAGKRKRAVTATISLEAIRPSEAMPFRQPSPSEPGRSPSSTPPPPPSPRVPHPSHPPPSPPPLPPLPAPRPPNPLAHRQ